MSRPRATAPLLPDELSHVKAALRPSERVSICEWAEREVVIPMGQPEPGPIKLSRTPYVREPLECFQDPNVEEITLPWSTQTAKTMVCLLGVFWAARNKPNAAMWVMPSKDVSDRLVRERLKPYVHASPALSDALRDEAHAETSGRFRFQDMTLMLAWANSPSMLSSDQVCYLILDEIDKYKGTIKEGSPDKLAQERTRWYKGKNRKTVRPSTPTLPDGVVWRNWQRSAQHRYHVPCPHCGQMQVLEWAQIKFPAEERDPETIIADRLAWYECAHCAGKIRDHHKPAMLDAGQWVPDVPRPEGAPRPRHVGFHLWAAYSPLLTFSDIVAEFLNSKDNPKDRQNFWNSWLALPWEQQVARINVGKGAEFCDGRKRGEVPAEAQLITTGADRHGERKQNYWSTWAYGRTTEGKRLWLIDWGAGLSDEALRALALNRAEVPGPAPWKAIVFGGMDSGYDAEGAYEFTRALYPEWRPTKGEEIMSSGKLVAESPIDYTSRKTGKRFTNLSLLRINTTHFKDLLAAMLSEPGRLFIPDEAAGSDFLKHLEAEHKVRTKGRDRWVKKYEGIPNHWLDTAVISMAVAERYGWSLLPILSTEAVEEVAAAPAAAPAPSEIRATRWIGNRRH